MAVPQEVRLARHAGDLDDDGHDVVAGGGGGGAPTTVDYLVGTASGGLSAEIVVGTTPGGELGGTWASPTVDTTHSGSSHASLSGQPGSTDVAVADGGTGASSASAARTNLGVVIGTDVEAHDADLTAIAGLSPSNDDIIQRKAGAWASRTVAQYLTDLGLASIYQPLDQDLTAFAALAIAADKLPYGTGSHTLGLTDLTAAARTVLDDTTVAAMVDTLGGASSTGSGGLVRATSPTLVTPALGTPASGVATNLTGTASGLTAGNVTTNANLTGPITSVGNATTIADAELAAIAGLTSAADKVPYFTGSGAAAVADFTATARSLVDDGSVGAMRDTLGLAFKHITGGTKFYPCSCSPVTNNQADTLNVLFAVPFWAPTSTAYDRIMVTVGGAVANATGRIGIYNDGGGKPGTLLVDAGSFGASGLATTGDKTITISQTLSGLYWLAFAGQTAAPNLVHATAGGGFINLGTTSGFSLSVVAAYSQTGVSGALPSPWGSTFTDNVRMPIIYLRAA